MEVVKTTCQLCRGTKFKVFYKNVKGFGTDCIFNLMQCQSCAIIFSYPTLSPNQTVAYYDSQEVAFSGKGGEKFLADYLENRTKYWDHLKFKDKLDEILLIKPKTKSILDIGCGAGLFLDYCRSRGLNTYGTEISNYGYELAAKKLKLQVFKTTLEGLAPKQFPPVDAITMYDVLEHTSNPGHNLKIVSNLLKESGVLVITLPNIDSLISKLTGKYWNKLIPPNHTFFFNRKTLLELIRSTNFQVEEISTINGESTELISEALASVWRLPSKVSKSVERAYFLKDEPLGQRKGLWLILVKGSRRVFSMLGFVGMIINPILTHFNSGEGLHLIAIKSSNSAQDLAWK